MSMTLNANTNLEAKGALDGQRYRESLDDGREVWLNGQRVDVTSHPAFQGTLDEFCRLYDLQWGAETRDITTYESPETGNRVSLSYLLPRTPEDLQAKRRNSDVWMRESWGQIGRAPDFMANVAVGLYDYRNELEGNDPRFGQHAVDYHRFAQEHDLSITHALGDPQVDRTASPLDDPDLALRIVRETDEGLVIRGAKQLATLAPLAHEVLVYLSAAFALRESEEFVIWFALPMATPGLKILCREPLGLHPEGHRHPFARRYDEQDAMLFFDDVLVPWNRVFLRGDGPLALRGLARINAWSLHSSHVRFYHRLRTYIGVSSMVARSIGVDAFRGIQEQLGELVSYAEMVRLAMRGSEADAEMTTGGLLAPARSMAIGMYATQVSSRVVEVLRRIAASGMLMQPSEADLASPELRPYLERYMHGKDIDVDRKSRLFRLAWDLAGDGSSSRQELYEYLHRGDPTRTKMNMLRAYDLSDLEQRIDELISVPLP